MADTKEINALINSLSKLGLGNSSKSIAEKIVKMPGQKIVQTRIEGWGGEEIVEVNEEELKRKLGIKGGKKHRYTHRRKSQHRKHTRRHKK